MVELTRRILLRGAATFGAVQLAFPKGAHAQGRGPETKVAHLGYSQMADAAPLIVAKEKGFFAKHGHALPDEALPALQAMLDEDDVDIMSWAVGRVPVPERYAGALGERLVLLDYIDTTR